MIICTSTGCLDRKACKSHEKNAAEEGEREDVSRFGLEAPFCEHWIPVIPVWAKGDSS